MSDKMITVPTFEYGTARLKELSVTAKYTPKEKGKGNSVVVRGVDIDGRFVVPTQRFWTSLQCRFGFSSNIFRYFDHKEVFDRVSSVCKNDVVRYCIEKSDKKESLLAVTNPNSAVMSHEKLCDLMNRYNAEKFTYSNGIVRSTHTPKITQPFSIGGDDFSNQFVIDTPIDGFGKPNVFLSLLRLICSNGAVGYVKTFRSELPTGKNGDDMAFNLARAMDGFNNEEGFAAMRNRFEQATKSWASVAETQRLYRALSAMAGRGELATIGRQTLKDGQVIETASPIFHDFHKLTGDLVAIYGLTTPDSLSVKRQRTLPTTCKVYDLLNFATEVATHHSAARGDRRLQAYVGEMLSHEYDLEGTVDQFSDWQDFFIGSAGTTDTLQFLNSRRAN